MIEVRIHGRGGQGNVVAAYLLATAAIDEGQFGQAFPAFGAERRGAPVVAFVRVADRALHRRDQVQHPAFLIIQDQALLHVPGVTDGLLPDGKILVNASVPAASLNGGLAANMITVPATAMAKEFLGRPVPNTALLAAFLALTELLPIEALLKALRERFKGDILERNTRLVYHAADQVTKGLWREVSHAASA